MARCSPFGWTDTATDALLALAGVAAPAVWHFSLSLTETSDPRVWRSRAATALLTSLVAVLFMIRQLSLLKAFEQSERARLVSNARPKIGSRVPFTACRWAPRS